MSDDQDQQPSPTEIHAARLRTASPLALREMSRKWEITAPLLNASPKFDPTATPALQARKHHVSKSAVYRWLGLCERGTGTAIDLLELPRGGRGKSRTITDPALTEFATVNCLQFCRTTGKPKPAIAAVMRLVTAYAADYGWEIPTRHALRRLLWSIPLTARLYAAKGKEGLTKAMPKPPVHRAGRPNEAWTSDHKEMHIGVLCTDGGAPFRPDLTVLLDRFDQCVLGFCLSRQGNGETFGRALRMALLPKEEDPEHLLLGRPDKMVTDRGQDFIGVYVRGILQKLGIEPQETIGRAPWSKGDVEGFFAILDRMFVEFLRGHTGARPTEKPVDREPVYDLHTLERLLRQWCFQIYNHLPFMNRRINGQQISRLELRRSVPFPIHTVEALDIDTLLLPRVTRTFGKQGITIDGIPYWNDSSRAFLALAADRVTVECGVDPSDRGKILIFHQNRFLCHAFNWDAAKAGVTQEHLKQRLHDRRHFEKAVRDAVDPKLQASVNMEDYIARLAAQNARETAQIAATAGERPRIPIMLPAEASTRRRPAGPRGAQSPQSFRRAAPREAITDPYLTPIPGSEVTE